MCITVADIIPVALFRFADFIEGSPHLMPNEVSVHAQEYGLGGLLFDTDDEDDEDEDDEEDSFMPMMKPEWVGVVSDVCKDFFWPFREVVRKHPHGFQLN